MDSLWTSNSTCYYGDENCILYPRKWHLALERLRDLVEVLCTSAIAIDGSDDSSGKNRAADDLQLSLS
jgi:hypothetical protein